MPAVLQRVRNNLSQHIFCVNTSFLFFDFFCFFSFFFRAHIKTMPVPLRVDKPGVPGRGQPGGRRARRRGRKDAPAGAQPLGGGRSGLAGIRAPGDSGKSWAAGRDGRRRKKMTY